MVSFLSTVIMQTLLVALASIFIDFVLGVLISIKKKEFSLNVLPQFIATNVFPYVGGLVVLALLSSYLAQMEYVYYGAIVIVTAKFSKEALLDKIQILFV